MEHVSDADCALLSVRYKPSMQAARLLPTLVQVIDAAKGTGVHCVHVSDVPCPLLSSCTYGPAMQLARLLSMTTQSIVAAFATGVHSLHVSEMPCALLSV